jgi:spore maturation protein CgeB
MHALASFGHEIIPFDTTPWTTAQAWNRIFCSLAHRTNWGPNVWGFNKALSNHSRSVGDVDLIWVDKGRWLYPETLDLLKHHLDCRALHYTPDPQLAFNQSRYFERCMSRYDWVVTTKPFECEMYRNHGAQNVLFVLQGFDSRFATYQSAPQEHADWRSDVCFVGHCEKHYAETLMAASDEAGQLKIWGPKWPRYATKNTWARPYVCGNGVWGEDYLRALSHTKIGLGFLTKKGIPETTTTRSFEIPALGTFLLAERTDDHLSLFEEGKEAEFFGSNDELKDKIRFYLAHEDVRKKIAASGRERCLRSGYASTEQLKKILTEIKHV